MSGVDTAYAKQALTTGEAESASGGRETSGERDRPTGPNLPPKPVGPQRDVERRCRFILARTGMEPCRPCVSASASPPISAKSNRSGSSWLPISGPLIAAKHAAMGGLRGAGSGYPGSPEISRERCLSLKLGLGGGVGAPFCDLMFVENSERPQKTARSVSSGVPDDNSRAGLRIDEQFGTAADAPPGGRRSRSGGVVSNAQFAGQAPETLDAAGRDEKRNPAQSTLCRRSCR
jgi:hypothetical protein